MSHVGGGLRLSHTRKEKMDEKRNFHEEAEKELREKIKLAYQKVAEIDVPSEEDLEVIERVLQVMDDVFGVNDRREMLTN